MVIPGFFFVRKIFMQRGLIIKGATFQTKEPEIFEVGDLKIFIKEDSWKLPYTNDNMRSQKEKK